MLIWTQTKLLWGKDFSKSILVKVLFEGFAESVSLSPSWQCGQGSGGLVRSWSAVPRDGAAHPPPPVHTFLSCPWASRPPAAPCLTSSVECLLPRQCLVRVFLTWIHPLPIKGRENSLVFCCLFFCFGFFFFSYLLNLKFADSSSANHGALLCVAWAACGVGFCPGDGGVCMAVFGFGYTALWTVGVPSLVATEILEVQHVFHSSETELQDCSSAVLLYAQRWK